MRFVRTIAVAGLAMAPVAAHAQHTKAGTSGRIAGIAPAPVIVNPIIAPGRFLSGSVPIIITPDGRVFANFGGGFEQVVTGCGASGVVVTNDLSSGVVQPSVVQPTVAQPGIVAGPLPYTPAVPNQETASQQMLRGSAIPVQTQRQVVVRHRSCWWTGGHGQVFVDHP